MTRGRAIPILLLIFALFVSVLACGSSDDSPPESPPESVAESVAEEPETIEEELEPTAEPSEPEPPTEPLQVGDITIAALSVVDPDEPGLFYSPEEGKHIISIEIVIDNGSDESASINPLNATLIDSQGLAYMAELAASDTYDQIETLDLYPGERIHGWISFAVEDGSTPAKLKYELDMWTGEMLEVDLAEIGSPPEWEELSVALAIPKLGETHTVSDYSLTALEVVDPSEPGLLYTPVAGLRLISVEIQIKNETGSDPLSVNPLYAYLVDNHGFVYGAELGSSELGQIDVLDLAAGEAAKGYVTFEIPEDRMPFYLRYVTDFWGFEEPLTVGLQ